MDFYCENCGQQLTQDKFEEWYEENEDRITMKEALLCATKEIVSIEDVNCDSCGSKSKYKRKEEIEDAD